jgi:hypothetical protein
VPWTSENTRLHNGENNQESYEVIDIANEFERTTSFVRAARPQQANEGGVLGRASGRAARPSEPVSVAFMGVVLQD